MQCRHVGGRLHAGVRQDADAIAQNGLGITNFVTPIKTAYCNHTPLLLLTLQAANETIGQGGFQEIPQMKLFEEMVCYQEEVRDPTRVAEVLNRVIEQAWRKDGLPDAKGAFRGLKRSPKWPQRGNDGKMPPTSTRVLC